MDSSHSAIQSFSSFSESDKGHGSHGVDDKKKRLLHEEPALRLGARTPGKFKLGKDRSDTVDHGSHRKLLVAILAQGFRVRI